MEIPWLKWPNHWPGYLSTGESPARSLDSPKAGERRRNQIRTMNNLKKTDLQVNKQQQSNPLNKFVVASYISNSNKMANMLNKVLLLRNLVVIHCYYVHQPTSANFMQIAPWFVFVLQLYKLQTKQSSSGCQPINCWLSNNAVHLYLSLFRQSSHELNRSHVQMVSYSWNLTLWRICILISCIL